MPSFSPTFISNTIPAVSVTSTNISYGEIKRSLGDYVFFVEEIYLYSANPQQIQQIMNFQRYRASGDKTIESLAPTTDPYQTLTSLFFKPARATVVVDGQNSFKFILKANTSLVFRLYTISKSKEEALNMLHENNFKQLETALGRFTFFEDWNNKL